MNFFENAMDIFNMGENDFGFPELEVEAPKKEKPKSVNPKAKKAVKPKAKKAVKPKAEQKNLIKLPAIAYVQAYGKIELDFKNEDGTDKETMSDVELREILTKNHKFMNERTTIEVSSDGNSVYVGCSEVGVGGEIEIAANSKIIFGNFSLDLAELSGGELESSKATSTDLATFITNQGLPMGESKNAKFTVFKDGVIIPHPAVATDKDIEGGLSLPVSVHMYGDWDNFEIDLEAAKELLNEKDDSKIKVTSEMLSKAIENMYPEFKNHIRLCALDRADNSIGCYLSVTTGVAAAKVGKKETMYKVNANTVISLWNNPFTPFEILGEGEFTKKQICEYLVSQRIREAAYPENIFLVQKDDLIMAGFSGGGSKGAF